MLPVEFIIEGPPVSQQTRRRQRRREWVQTIRQEAERAWQPGDAPALGVFKVTITYLYTDIALDLDNLAKPILDALKGVIIFDDDQVTDVVLRKRMLQGNLRIEDPSPALARGLETGREFLHVVTEQAPDQEMLR